VNHRGAPAHDGFELIPNTRIGDVYGRDQIPGLRARFEPDIVFLCHDYGFYGVHEGVLLEYRKLRPAARVVVYCPIEWAEMMPGNLASLRSVDRLVLYTEFGRRVVEGAFHQLGGTAPVMSVIPHGLDGARFRALAGGDFEASRREARRRLWNARTELADAFIVLNANRNVPRKRVDLTLEAFARFAVDKPDAFLYLHMGLEDTGIDILTIVRRLGIEDKILLTSHEGARPQVSDEELNVIYNACDVGINTSTGEGWGLVAFEHAATGAPQIVPNHSACAELWADAGLLIDLEPSDTGPSEVSIRSAVDQLDRLYRDEPLRVRLSEAGRRKATSPELSWAAVAATWAGLLDQIRPHPAEDRH
jgi:D-inositol-3-phosphate glycosyltransferase